MDATLHREAMHIQNSAAGGVPGQRSLLFCARTIARRAWSTSPQIRLLHFESPDRFSPGPPLSFRSSPPPCPSRSPSSTRASSAPLPSPHHLCSLPLRRGALRVLTPRRMSGVMNFNSFTPRHVGVEGRAGANRGDTGTGKNGDEFFARQIVDRLD
jgi:hypothetical protein